MLKKLIELKNNSGFMKYFKNTSWLMIEKILRIVAALTIGAWVIRYLGPTDYGILSVAQAFVGLFIAFSSLGLDGLLARELVGNADKKNTLLGTAFVMQTLGSTILTGFLLIAIYFRQEDSLSSKIMLILALMTFVNSFNVIGAYFQSIVKSKMPVITSIVGLVISSLIKVYLILNNFSLIYFAYALLFDTVFLALGLIYVYHKSNESLFKWKFSSSLAKSLISDSWPLIMNTIFISIYVRIDQIMIEAFMEAEFAGQYSAAVNLSQAWYFIPGIISGSLFPAIINAKRSNESLYKDRLQQLYDLMVVIALAIAIPMTFLSDWVVSIIYDDQFYLTGGVLSIHIWSGVFVFLGVSVQKWILAENLQRVSTFTRFIGMAANIILNYILIPTYGIYGAAFATLFSQAISVLFAPLLFRKTRPSFFMMIKALSFVNLFKKIR